MKNRTKKLLKEHTFYVPYDLVGLIAQAPMKEQIAYAAICNEILFRMTSNDDEHQLASEFIAIPFQAFNAVVASYSSRYTKQLEKWNIIEIDHNYKHNDFNTAYSKCKGYRLMNVDELVLLTLPRRSTQNINKDQLKTVIQRHVVPSMKQLTVSDDFEEEEDKICRFKQRTAYQNILERKFNCKYGQDDETHRLFNEVITMKRAWRKWLQHESGATLVEIDVANCFGWLLASMIEDKAEKEKFITMLNNDFYSTMALEMNIDRDQAKKKFLVMLSAKRSWSNETINWFNNNFPSTTEMILNWTLSHDETLALKLQKLESKIMLEQVGRRMYEAGYFWVNEHDGCLVLQRNAATVQDIIKEEWFKALKLQPRITVKALHAIC